MQMYKIVRKFYRNTRDMEDNKPNKVYDHNFRPMTLEEAQIVKPKLAAPKFAIDFIHPIRN